MECEYCGDTRELPILDIDRVEKDSRSTFRLTVTLPCPCCPLESTPDVQVHMAAPPEFPSSGRAMSEEES